MSEDFATLVDRTLNMPEAHEKYLEQDLETITKYHLKEGSRLGRLKSHNRASFHFFIASRMLRHRELYRDAYKARCRTMTHSRYRKDRLLNGHLFAMDCISKFDGYKNNIGDLTLLINHSLKASNLAKEMGEGSLTKSLMTCAKAYELISNFKDDLLKIEDWISAIGIYDVLRLNSPNGEGPVRDVTRTYATNRILLLGSKIFDKNGDDTYLNLGIRALKDLSPRLYEREISKGRIQNLISIISDSEGVISEDVKTDILFYGSRRDSQNNRIIDLGFNERFKLK